MISNLIALATKCRFLFWYCTVVHTGFVENQQHIKLIIMTPRKVTGDHRNKNCFVVLLQANIFSRGLCRRVIAHNIMSVAGAHGERVRWAPMCSQVVAYHAAGSQVAAYRAAGSQIAAYHAAGSQAAAQQAACSHRFAVSFAHTVQQHTACSQAAAQNTARSHCAAARSRGPLHILLPWVPGPTSDVRSKNLH